MARVFLELEQGLGKRRLQGLLQLVGGPRVVFKTRPFHVDRRGKDGILTHTDPKGDMPEDADTPAPTVTPTDA